MATWTPLLCVLLAVTTLIKVALAEHSPHSIVHTDIAILGGGASGTYAAIRLREDYGKRVLLIEMESVLGGHVNTYTIPETGEAFNYGVQSYIDYKGAKGFFERFNIPLQTNVLFSSNTINVDPNTGIVVPTPPGSSIDNSSIAALQKYYNIILPWNDIMLPGYWNFPSGDQIPADLLLPFSDFVKKYDLEAMEPIIFVVSGQTVKSPQLTLYTVKNFGTPVVEGFLNNTFFDPLPFNNSLLYGKAEKLLGADVMLTSTIVEAKRSTHGVSLTVKNIETGRKTSVFAKTLLVSAPPSFEDLAVLGFDKEEISVFSTWSYGTVYTATLKTNLIPDNTSLAFTTAANLTTTPPYSFTVSWNGVPGYFWLIFTSELKMSADEAKKAILAEMKVLSNSGAFTPTGNSVSYSEIVAISNHSSVTWGQSAQQLKDGFIQHLYALQGHKSTWYTGGLWCPDYSSNVWAFTDTILPKLLKSLM